METKYTQKLPAGNYAEYLIPKKGKGKFRKITAPSPDLLTYQRSQKKQLEDYLYKTTRKTTIANTIHGFMRNRNCVTGAMQHVKYQTTIMMDISDFFDSVTKDMLPQQFAIDRSLFHQQGYAAQGFATSPLLANIALLTTLTQIHEMLDDFFEDFAFTIYADDVQVSVNEEDYEEINEIIENITAIVENQGFKINAHKTRIKYAKYGYRRILGVNVGDTHVRATRKTMRKIRAARHQSKHAKTPEERRHAASSLGGLITWSKCIKPKHYK